MNTISNKEAALLCLLSEKPKHAYEIERDIQERDMRYWTEISMSSVYKLLHKLEKQGLLKSALKLSKNNLAQKVYTLTAKGKKEFKRKLIQLLGTWESTRHPLDIGLASLWLLDREEAITMLGKYGEQLERMLGCYSELETYLKAQQCPPGNIQLARRRLFLLEGEKKWLDAFLGELNK